MCFPCFQILGGGRNLTLIFSRSIWELHLSNVPSPGLQTSALMISTLETSLQFPKFFGGGVVLRLEKWVSGAYSGHTAVCLRESKGKLWVDEFGHDNEQAEDVIAMLPWDGWWEFELNKDNSNPHIALLPLHPDMRAKFNETAAWKYAQSMNGKPYGYHNMLFSWIDTIDANYPPPLDAHVVTSIMTVWNQMQPAYAANMWNEALNKRLGTEGLDLPDLMVETKMRGSSFAELLTIPEQDDWVYSNRKSASCVALFLKYTKQQDSLIQFLAPFK